MNNAQWIETPEGHYRFVYEGNNAIAIFVNEEGLVTEVLLSSGEITISYDFKEYAVYGLAYSLDHREFKEDWDVYAGVFNESDKDWLISRTLEYCVSGSDFNVSMLLSKNISLIAKPLKKEG